MSDSVYFASTYSILPSLKNEVKVTSYIGTWQEPEANLTIPKGKYAYIEFSGTWNEYIFFQDTFTSYLNSNEEMDMMSKFFLLIQTNTVNIM